MRPFSPLTALALNALHSCSPFEKGDVGIEQGNCVLLTAIVIVLSTWIHKKHGIGQNAFSLIYSIYAKKIVLSLIFFCIYFSLLTLLPRHLLTA